MSIEIRTLIENEGGCLPGEFGLSLLIQDKTQKILFDTGQTGAFVENAKKLGLDLEEIQALVLSHSHFDHTGGVPALLAEREKPLDIFVSPSFFREKYKKTEEGWKFLGNPFTKEELLKKGGRLHPLEGKMKYLTENICLHTDFQERNSFETVNPLYYYKDKEDYILDHMEDEVAISIETKKGVYLLVACSHIGIVNIVEEVKERLQKPIYGLIGGLHLSKVSKERKEKVLNYFKESEIQFFAVSHCTGRDFMAEVKDMGKEFLDNRSGCRIEL